MTDEQAAQSAEQQAQPPSTHPEEKTFQLVYTKYDDGDAMHREGLPSTDAKNLTDTAVKLLQRHEVREVFLCTVHAAFSKEINIKKVI